MQKLIWLGLNDISEVQRLQRAPFQTWGVKSFLASSASAFKI